MVRTGGRGNGGCGGKGDGKGVSVHQWTVFRSEKFPVRAGKQLTREISRRFSFTASVALDAAVPRFLLSAFFVLENRRDARAPFSGGFENPDAAVVQMDFRCFPCLTLVVAIWIGIGWVPCSEVGSIRVNQGLF